MSRQRHHSAFEWLTHCLECVARDFVIHTLWLSWPRLLSGAGRIAGGALAQFGAYRSATAERLVAGLQGAIDDGCDGSTGNVGALMSSIEAAIALILEHQDWHLRVQAAKGLSRPRASFMRKRFSLYLKVATARMLTKEEQSKGVATTFAIILICSRAGPNYLLSVNM